MTSSLKLNDLNPSISSSSSSRHMNEYAEDLSLLSHIASEEENLYGTVFSVELLSLFKCQCVYCRVVQPLEISMFSVELLSITLCKCQCVHTALVI